MQEVAEEFGGEDPLQPDVRALLDGCLNSCTELRDQMAAYVEIEPPEPAEDDVAQVRALIEKVGRRADNGALTLHVALSQQDTSVTDTAPYLDQFQPLREMSRETMLVKLPRIPLAAGALLLMLASAACSGGSPYGTSTASTPASTTSASSSGSPASGGMQQQLTITAKDFSFSADAVNVAKGDTIAITFKNSGAANHTLAFYSDAAYKNAITGGDTGSVSGGATKTLTVTADVGLFYRCNIHPTQMQGKIDFK